MPWFDTALDAAKDRTAERTISSAALSVFAAIERSVPWNSSELRLQRNAPGNERGWEATKGGRYWSIAHHPEQATYYARVASTPGITNICEVGFNAGHSTAIWLTSNPRGRAVTFDNMGNSYSRRCKEELMRRFSPTRWELHEGNSARTIPGLGK